MLRKYRRALWGNVPGTELVELRQHGKAVPYIAIYAVNKHGKRFKDDLLLYEDPSQAADDWALLTGSDKVRPHELSYCERIVQHSTGYRRDGRVTVY